MEPQLERLGISYALPFREVKSHPRQRRPVLGCRVYTEFHVNGTNGNAYTPAWPLRIPRSIFFAMERFLI